MNGPRTIAELFHDLTVIYARSGMTMPKFCRAVYRLAGNDALMQTALKDGHFERSNDNPIATQLPIATAGDNFVFVKPI